MKYETHTTPTLPLVLFCLFFFQNLRESEICSRVLGKDFFVGDEG